MPTLASLISAIIFVLLGGFGVWTMVASPSRPAAKHQLWTRLHRAVCYVFVAMFVFLTYFKIEYVRSGVISSMRPATTVLEASELHGVRIPYGCRQGACGTCATRLLRGTVRMDRDEGLADDLRAKATYLHV